MQGGFVVKKREMTKVWKDGIMEVVTILEYVPQEVLRYKTEEKDGYNAVVIGVEKKNKEVKSYEKNYSKIVEFKIDEEFKSFTEQGNNLLDLLEGVDVVRIEGYSKGKGYQGAMKRFGLSGGPETHGSKFHRQVGSLGNRKPRRVQKGHPHAGRMGREKITLKRVKIVDYIEDYKIPLVLVKGAVPGYYGSYVKLIVKK